MSNFQLIATDLDGTLFFDRENISDRDRAALVRVKSLGIPCAIATGRELDAVMPALDRLQLWPYFSYIIHSGGAGCYDMQSKENTMVGMMDCETLCTIYDRVAPLGLPFILPADGKLYTSRRTPRLVRESELLSCPLIEVADFKTILKQQPRNKLILNAETDEVERALPILQADTDPRYQWHRSHDNYIDCYARGVHKGSALRALCETLQIPLANTLAIGDNENDIQLLEAAGVSACPADAVDSVRQRVDYISCTAREGAFASFCEAYLFCEK